MDALRLLLYCRAGFESDCAAEVQDLAARAGLAGYARAEAGAAYLEFVPLAGGGEDPDATAVRLWRSLAAERLCFPRQALPAAPPVRDLPAHDRATPLARAAAELAARAGLDPATALGAEPWLETPDTNAGKSLARLCRQLRPPLSRALTGQARRSDAPAGPVRPHFLFVDGGCAYPALALTELAAPWPLGIPRLRLARDAPSRATLKLDEALMRFLDERERGAALSPGLRAVDLGAAPGGWSWLLARHHLRVTAVDNGPMDAALMDSGLVEHRREDGFRYRPASPVDWLVCDMVERPGRVAHLVGEWAGRGDCRRAVFNLKLPMKQRHAELQRCRGLIEAGAAAGPDRYRLRFKQLYHDRAEVTGYLGPA